MDRYRLLVQHAPICIHEIGLDGRLTAMNPAGLAMMGVTDEGEVCGLPYLGAVSDADRPRVEALLERALGGEEVRFEFVSAGEAPRTFSSNFIPVRDETGGLLRLMGVTQDVTEQREAERAVVELNRDLEHQVEERTAELRAANADLTRRNAELDEFAWAVSHDLKEPLSTVTMLASALRGGPAEETDAALGHIADAGARMGRMIDALLLLSRVGRARLTPEDRADLGEVLRTVQRDLTQAIKRSRAVVTADSLPTAFGSPIEQRRLLQNLLSNAIKFAGEAPPRVHVSAAREGELWRVSVRDNGIGIAEEKRDSVFRVFERVGELPEVEGTGVGLALCKKIVEARGGTIRVDPAPGGGSTFSYTLPV